MELNNTDNLALVHSIESFGTVDGPGIRFVIFLQGCKLKCKFCHNRDTWNFNSGEIIEVEELIKNIKRYKTYIVSSGGGVTVSGGEPLLQSKVVANLFKKLKELDIHTALDTAGSLEIDDNIKEVLKYTDLVLLDIKHIDEEQCKLITGFSNNNTLEFAKYLSENNIATWIRYVVVPTLSNKKEDIINLKKFIKTLKTVEKVDFLPYHSMGKIKWKALGLKYPLENIKDATIEDIKLIKDYYNN